MNKTLFITGTDTGVGKTVLAALLVEYLRRRGVRVAAVKPVCSGGRDDARMLRAALGGTLSLEEINPWHFRAPLAPVLAAKRENKRLKLAPVLAHIRGIQEKFDVVVIEGAGGLLSPLGVDFNSRDVMAAVGATPVIVASNKLGVVNHILLTLEALPKDLRARTGAVLMTPPKPDSATASNARLLTALSVQNVHRLRWLGVNFSTEEVLQEPRVQQVLAAVTD